MSLKWEFVSEIRHFLSALINLLSSFTLILTQIYITGLWFKNLRFGSDKLQFCNLRLYQVKKTGNSSGVFH